jgi:LVIVD repeat
MDLPNTQRSFEGLALGLAGGVLAACLFFGTLGSARAANPHPIAGASPALCGSGDTREPGIQGDVPAGATGNFNCGVKLVGQLPRSGNVQGYGTCVYVRPRAQPGPQPGDPPGRVGQQGGQVLIIDVRNPAHPVEVGSVPVKSGSETMRVVVAKDRAILVSGSSVYDIKDCLHPVLKGEIRWPPLSMVGIPSRMLPHDLRVNHTATKVFAAFGLFEADISNLEDAGTWKVIDHRCELSEQVPGPWQDVHRRANAANLSLCSDAVVAAPMGAGFVVGASPLQASLLWPTLSHSPDFNADDTRLYIGDQAGGTSAIWAGGPKVRIVDITQHMPKIIGEVDGPGHGLDWFRVRGRDYLAHSNEGGTTKSPILPTPGDTCKPYPRPTGLGWGFEVLVSEVTDPAKAHNVSMLHIAINDAEFCEARKASGHDPVIAYHLVDNALDPHFVMVNFGSAGLRIFDIRDPMNPSEVAYFNHGLPVHAGVGHYDAKRGLIYASGETGGLWVLQLEPQVRKRLGL